MWRVTDGICTRLLHVHNCPVYALCLSRDGSLLHTGAADGRIRSWRAADGTYARTFEVRPNHTCFSTSIVLHRSALAGLASAQLLLGLAVCCSAAAADTARSHCKQCGPLSRCLRLLRWQGHTGRVHALVASRDEERMYSGGADALIVAWDLATGARAYALTAHTKAVQARCSPGRFNMRESSRPSGLRRPASSQRCWRLWPILVTARSIAAHCVVRLRQAAAQTAQCEARLAAARESESESSELGATAALHAWQAATKHARVFHVQRAAGTAGAGAEPQRGAALLWQRRQDDPHVARCGRRVHARVGGPPGLPAGPGVQACGP